MQEVARGMHELGVSAAPGFGGAGLCSRAPPAHIGCLARCGLFGLDVPSNHLPVLAFFSPEQRDSVTLCFRPFKAENGRKIAPILARASFRSHLVEVVKSDLGIADELRSQSVGNLVERERCLVVLFHWP